MYKLFLCLRYLRRRYIALVAIIGMALCVFMVLVVVSVMNGFLDLVARAAQGMMGEVIVDAPDGMGHYDDFIAELNALPEVRSATPVIYSAGFLRFGPMRRPLMVSVVGMRLPEATAVSTFAQGLHPPELQASPAFVVPESLRPSLREQNGQWQKVIDRLTSIRDNLEEILATEEENPGTRRDAGAAESLEADKDKFSRRIAQYRLHQYDEKLPGIIFGVDLPGTTRRDSKTGQYERYRGVGEKVVLTLFPIGRTGPTALTQPVPKTFALVGDSRTGIYQIDNGFVYVDFDTLQKLLEMDARQDVEGGAGLPGLCSQIQIKVEGANHEKRLLAVAEKVRKVWEAVQQRHPQAALVGVRTWRQKQALYVGPIEKQRTLVTIMFGVISMVAVVLVFAIFYMMVVQKTKDIGVLKSIGASSAGVAGIYLLYGCAVGLVGSAIGAVGGYWFVRRINAIHDWIAETFDWQVFDRQAYLFEKIPSQVQGEVIVGVLVGAMVAGILGATLPAIRAARMQPVEALRYE